MLYQTSLFYVFIVLILTVIGDSSCAVAALPVIPAPEDYELPAVKDVTELSFSDNTPYYALLHHADTVPQDELRRAGRAFVEERRRISGKPAFPDMLDHPQAWRGKPVLLRGHVLQTLQYPAAENPYGIRTLYETSLYPTDSDHHPLTVVFLEKPENLPIGGELINGVEVAGYFLKLYLYPSADQKTRKAPLILAKTVTVSGEPAFAPLVPRPILVTGIVLLAGLLAWFVWRLARPRRRPIESGEPVRFDRLE